MKLKPYLRNSARYGLLLSTLSLFLFGCTSSTTPTYLKKDIPGAVVAICKKEYGINLRATLVGHTLWVYLPLKDIFSAYEKKDTPQKYKERFLIENNDVAFADGILRLSYLIKELNPEEEKTQEYKYNEKEVKKINQVLQILRRVIFSADFAKENEPKFISVVIADIKYGFQISQIFYYLDFKKYFYQFISFTEYQNRTIQNIEIVPQAINDEVGLYIDYRDISMNDFIVEQIKQRIKLNFQKSEIKKNADIDKEVAKAVAYITKVYNFSDFSEVEMNNLATNKKLLFNRQAIAENLSREKF